ncbi:SMP-30/gluconolactonase/LRE family protein [Pseudobacteriovorax antillogorgiicola]|uniref:Gluconolactonase n=1 Tax=Pseudobacteriovorax antillogorgiicola TaxID=1513793 RepID=A0A1Y6C3T4_9BACT|nr:SMP-30/gluconolactonase/LRE family protein [Pseudobacteriovorax antillogorgiicola]TCS50691.1 gluconolactonase [Pseudobacteriovorax antillogorgiicola]SMF40334.1 gluconolactonase [Pseudobacteriovorax antillogorgiicola]
MKNILLSMILVASASAASAGSKVDAVKFKPGKAPKLEGALAPNQLLKDAEYLGAGLLDGPEDIAIGPDGWIYTGTADGYVKRVSFDGTVENVTYTGGHPLGMDFDAEGNLIVAEPYSGLLKVTPNGDVSVLADQAEGVPFRLTDDVKVASDGMIYFTDASYKFPLEDFELDVLEARGNGRLMSYNPGTGLVEVLVEGLYFANGVALSQDEDFILVNETSRYRMTRYWLKGEKAGTAEVFLSNLPGSPDGLARDSDGNFLIAFFSTRSKLIDFLQMFPKLKNLLSNLPRNLFPQPAAYGFVVVVSPEGEFIRSYHDTNGSVASAVTAVEEYQGQLIMGTLRGEQIMIVDK